MRYIKLCCRISNESFICKTTATDDDMAFAIGLYNDMLDNDEDFAEHIGEYLENELDDFEVIYVSESFLY
jgi:hypothetical protein